MNKFAEKRMIDPRARKFFFIPFTLLRLVSRTTVRPFSRCDTSGRNLSFIISTTPAISYRQEERRSQNPSFQNWVWSDIALRKIFSDLYAILETNPGPSSPKWNVENNKMPPLHRAASRGNYAVFHGPFLTSGTSSRSSLERSITRSCRMVSDILNALTTRNFSPSIFGCKPEFGTLIAEKFTGRLSLSPR